MSCTMVEFSKANLDSGASGIFFAIQMATTDRLTEEEYSRFGMGYDLPVMRVVRRAFFNTVHIYGVNILFGLIAGNYSAPSFSWHDQRIPPSLPEASKRFDGTLLGGLDEVGILVHGSVDDVQEMVRASVRSVNGRKLILAPGCVIPLDALESNLDAVARTARTYMDWR